MKQMGILCVALVRVFIMGLAAVEEQPSNRVRNKSATRLVADQLPAIPSCNKMIQNYLNNDFVVLNLST